MGLITFKKIFCMLMNEQSSFSRNESDVVISSLPCSDSQLVDSPRLLMDGLGTKHRVWFQQFGTRGERNWEFPTSVLHYHYDLFPISLGDKLNLHFGQAIIW